MSLVGGRRGDGGKLENKRIESCSLDFAPPTPLPGCRRAQALVSTLPSLLYHSRTNTRRDYSSFKIAASFDPPTLRPLRPLLSYRTLNSSRSERGISRSDRLRFNQSQRHSRINRSLPRRRQSRSCAFEVARKLVDILPSSGRRRRNSA